MMDSGKGIAIFLCLIAILVSANATSEEVEGVADVCKKGVQKVHDFLEQKAEQKHVTSLIWDFWQCIGDTEILDDSFAICDILGNIFKNVSQFQMVTDDFFQKQLHSACDLCDQAAARIQGVTDQDVKLGLDWFQSQIKDEKVAKAINEHGFVLANKLIESLYPHETCSDLAKQCESSRIPIPKPIKDFLKEILGNLTHCLECNVCENLVLYAQVHILPSPNLPGCLVTLLEDNVCVLLNQTLPGIGNQGYELCVKAIKSAAGNIVDALYTFIHPNLICNTALKACTPKYTDNILDCVCDNVRLPSALEWLMPCHWQHAS